MPHSRTHQDPVQPSPATATESISRNANGHSLDDARKTFRVEWQAKLQKRQEQAVRARRRAEGWERLPVKLVVGSSAIGALCSLLMGVSVEGARDFFTPAAALAGLGCTLSTPFAVAALTYAAHQQHRAEHLEREVQEMERPQPARRTMLNSRTEQEAVEHSPPVVDAEITRNTHGQSLDDARAVFRAEWQAKIHRKREQAATALSDASDLEYLAMLALGGGAIVGVLFGAMVGGGAGHLFGVLFRAVAGAVLGVTLALAPAGLFYGCTLNCTKRAERLEREAQELERS